MQRDLRGQREAASGDLSERAARKDTGHGITFFRICTFAYRVRENGTKCHSPTCSLWIGHGITLVGSCTSAYRVREFSALR